MADREKILHELDHQVADADWCDNDWKDNVPIWMLRGALTLLREQEPVKPKEEPYKIVCGVCGEKLAEICGDVDVVWNDDAKYPNFCPECGRKVKWSSKEEFT